ncbi:MAG: hypothetical protein QOC55_1118 [Thermoleophilaceae bacterium]|nr:hypothetical protein [Actinomycetota bacterium]MEA2483171.1 hypothetical protein [Thermoleophilaceae bacterium]
MVRSLGIVLAIVLFVWFFARPPHSDEKKLRVVDSASDVQAFTSIVPGVVVPRAMPTSWKQTVSRFDPDATELRLGWVTPTNHYAEYAATSRPTKGFLADITGQAAEDGTVDIDGTSWTRYRQDDAISLVHVYGTTTVVLGTLRDTATLDELRLLAGRLAR